VALLSFFSPMALLMVASALVAQVPANWDNVTQLAAGTEIRVIMTDGRNFRGEFQSTTGDALIVATSAAQESLNRPLITRVSSKSKSHRLRNTLIGLGVGGGTGLIIGAASDQSCARNGCFFGGNFGKEIFTPFGAAVGLVVGVVWPTGGWHDVYRAK